MGHVGRFKRTVISTASSFPNLFVYHLHLLLLSPGLILQAETVPPACHE